GAPAQRAHHHDEHTEAGQERAAGHVTTVSAPARAPTRPRPTGRDAGRYGDRVSCDPGTTVGDLSEDGLLAEILPRLPFGRSTVLGPGDDAAVVAAADGRVVASTDVLVEGRHFR